MAQMHMLFTLTNFAWYKVSLIITGIAFSTKMEALTQFLLNLLDVIIVPDITSCGIILCFQTLIIRTKEFEDLCPTSSLVIMGTRFLLLSDRVFIFSFTKP